MFAFILLRYKSNVRLMQTRSQTKQLNLFSKRTKTKNRILWFILADFCLLSEKNHYCLKAIHNICRYTLKYVTVFLHLSFKLQFFLKYWSFLISFLSAFMLSTKTYLPLPSVRFTILSPNASNKISVHVSFPFILEGKNNNLKGKIYKKSAN